MKELNPMNLKYFKDEEFKLAMPACSLSQMDEVFMKRLDDAREYAGIPFIINSAFRSVEYEKSKGRSGTSQHTKGLAVDIRCINNAQRFRILASLIMVGFRRIGIGTSFIHVDAGYPNSEPIIWTY